MWIKNVTTRKEQYMQHHTSDIYLLQFIFHVIHETNALKDQELEELNQKRIENKTELIEAQNNNENRVACHVLCARSYQLNYDGKS